MSSGSLKDLTKAITSFAPQATLPLPEDLVQLIDTYIEKHSAQDESDSQRLQEELLNVYASSFLRYPARLAPFLRVLRALKPLLSGSSRSLQWWDKLSTPVTIHLGAEKGLAYEARDTLLEILVYDEEQDASRLEDARVTSDGVAESLLATWLEKTEIAAGQFDEHASFVVKQVQLILNAFGKKRPKEFLQLINKAFVKKSSRISALSLLCDFIRQQPPHLHQLLQTPLFDNLLQCLQIDTSTRVISLGITALIMFLPHIPSSAANHLPPLFNIYSRLLFWDRERRAADILPRTEKEADEESSISEKQSSEPVKSWDKLAYLLESDDDSVPELLHYFTFLYGLYPINFMSYIRKPQRYLRHADFPGADDLNIEPDEIRQRSEPFRQVHLLHPNFFTFTIESETSDKNRWMKTEAADVVAECMALYVPSEEGPYTLTRSRGQPKKIEQSSDVPDQPLLDSEAATPYQSRHTSWRNTQSTAVASPEVYRPSGLHRKLSQTSQSMASTADSPLLHSANHLTDSPTLPPMILGSPSNHRLSGMLSSQRSTRGSIYQALTNDSVASLSLSNNHQESNVDAYLDSLSRDHTPQSPTLRPTTTDAVPTLKVAYLQREIQLLKNDLNFERYLKQQHVSHIGHLRRKQIREARVEAETQNLVNSNRTLKTKLEEAKRLNLQMKQETEKSKQHSRKWEGDLTAKLRVLREEQKKWNKEREELKHNLNIATDYVTKLKNIVVETESRELRAQQKVASVESNLDELERLRVEVEVLKQKVLRYEVGELAALKALQNEQAALNHVEILEMELRSRDMELVKSKRAFEAKVEAVRLEVTRGSNENQNGEEAEERKSRLSREVLDRGMSALREENANLERMFQYLYVRHQSLVEDYHDLLQEVERLKEDDKPLLSRGSTSFGPPSRQRSLTHSSDAGFSLPSLDSMGSYGSGSSNAALLPKSKPRPKVDTNLRTSASDRSPPDSPGGIQYFMPPQPFSPGMLQDFDTRQAAERAASGSRGSNESRTKAPKINPHSDARIYGRGGQQNIGKKDKAKIVEAQKEKDRESKESQPAPAAAEPKKEKKTLGIRGLRGFV